MRRVTRVKRIEHVDTDGSWAISYGDMITLLMTFFVLYFTIDHKKERANKMEQSLMVRLQENGLKANQDGLKQQMNVGLVSGEGIDPKIMSDLGAEVHKIDRAMVVDFNDVSFFELGNVDVNKKGKNVLAEFAKIYQPFAGNYQISIQAYTDVRKVKSTNPRYRDNLELSALRSVASMRVLQRAGIPLNRMKIAGYGELIETQSRLMKLQDQSDPLKYSRKVVLVIEPETERN